MSVSKGLMQAASGVSTGGGAWYISTAQWLAEDVNYLYVGSQDTSPEGLFFKPDGTKVYFCGSTGDAVYEYDLSTAWDISTASYLQNFDVSTQEASQTGLFFKPDGTKMYIVGGEGDDVNEYDLSTEWDTSTASFSQNFSVSSQHGLPTDMFFKPDGTKMYIVGRSADNVSEYNLSTAWDVSSASYVQNFSVASQDSSPQGLFFKPDGLKMYVASNTSDAVFEYDLSTAWDVSSASYNQNFSVVSQDSASRDVHFKSDGTVMYVTGSATDAVYQYQLSTAWDISSASYQEPTTRYFDVRKTPIQGGYFSDKTV